VRQEPAWPQPQGRRPKGGERINVVVLLHHGRKVFIVKSGRKKVIQPMNVGAVMVTMMMMTQKEPRVHMA
jgi:hypothetical protein